MRRENLCCLCAALTSLGESGTQNFLGTGVQVTESDDGEGCSLWTGPGGVTLGGGVWGFNVWVENEHGSRIYTGTSLPLSLVPFTSLAGCWRRRSGFSPGAGCSVETFFSLSLPAGGTNGCRGSCVPPDGGGLRRGVGTFAVQRGGAEVRAPGRSWRSGDATRGKPRGANVACSVWEVVVL